MKNSILLLMVLSFSLLACTEDPMEDFAPRDPVFDDGVKEALDGGLATIDMDDITSKEYYLKAPLEFTDQDFIDTKVAEGTQYERTLRVFSKTYQEQKVINPLELEENASYCAIVFDTDDSNQASDIEFELGRLRKLQVSQTNASSNDNGNKKSYVHFSIGFQSSVFRHFVLSCTNVKDSAGITKHVGQLIDVVEEEDVAAPEIKVVEPTSLGVQYVSNPADPNYPSINHVVTVAKEDLPENKEFALDLNVYKVDFSGSRELVAGPIRVHDEAGEVAGPLSLTFHFGESETFAADVINGIRTLEYEFVTAENSGFVLKMAELCESKSGSFLSLDSSAAGCPNHIPDGLMAKTMLVAASSCTDDDFQFSKISAVSTQQKQGGQRSGSPCELLIWDLVEDGLRDTQVSYLHGLTRSFSSSDKCKDIRSHVFYSALRRAERNDALVFGQDQVTPVSDQAIYELCLARKSM